MKIIHINCVYNSGSTGKIVHDVHSYLSDIGQDSLVIYGRLGKTDDKNVYKLCSETYSKANHLFNNIIGITHGGCRFSTNRIISFIKKEAPDIVHLHCINGYFVNIYRLVAFLKKSGIKTVLTLHAEFMYTGGCGHSGDCDLWRSTEGCRHCPSWKRETGSLFFDRTHTMWKRMRAAFENFDENLIVTSVSPWLKSRAEISEILKGKRHKVVLDGVDTDIFHPSDGATVEALRKELGLGQEKVVLHVTPAFSDDPHHLKGGYYILKLAEMMPEVKFLIAGRAKKGISLPPNVRLLGMVSPAGRLAKLYSLADLCIIASKRETFSMVTAESLCCGTPVAGFEAGAPEQIALETYSQFGVYGDLDKLRQKAQEFLCKKWDNQEIALAAAERYAKKKMIKAYMAVYEEMLTD